VSCFFALNIASPILPIGIGGKFKVGARSKYNKTLKRLYGNKAASIAKSPKALKDTLFIASIRTVKSNDKQHAHHENEWYSVVDEIIDLA
jgi:hypothetical protein|tara:strand:- start:420 stop:689 length:270 start_codon:yes stop_codon:yes gene_type:complete